MAIGDINGDGNLDVFVSGGSTDPAYNLVNFSLGDGKGHLGPWMSYFVAPIAGGFAALADIQGKGALDAAILNSEPPSSSSLQTLFNRGNGQFDVPSQLLPYLPNPLLPSVQDMRIIDVSGDGKPDLVLLLSSAFSQGADAVAIFPNSGSFPYFQAANPFIIPLPTNSGAFIAGSLAIADFNNDGLNDVFVTNDNGDAGSSNMGVLLVSHSAQNLPGYPIDLQPGDISTGNNFTNAQNPTGSAVFGSVFIDENRNGVQDAGETGKAGMLVFADLDHSGQYKLGDPFTYTIAGGLYTLPALRDGIYSIGVIPTPGFKLAGKSATIAPVTVDGSRSAKVDLGVVSSLIAPLPDQNVPPGRALVLTVGLTEMASGRKLLFSLDPGAPDGSRIDPATGRFSWTPTMAQATQSYVVTVRVRDPYQPLFTDVASFTVHAIGTLVLNAIGPAAGTPWQTLDYTFSVQSISAPLFTYTIDWGDGQTQTVTAGLRLFLGHSYAKPGLYTVAATVSDPHGDSGSVSTAVRVTAPQPSGFGAGRDAFVTTLYREQLGRYPDAGGLSFWSGRLAAGLKPEAAAVAIGKSPEHRTLVLRHLIPQIPLVRSYADALRAGTKAARARTHTPSGPLALAGSR